MFTSVLKKTGLAALAVVALATGASFAGTTAAEASPYRWTGKHGGHGWGHGHGYGWGHGHGRRWRHGFYGPRFGAYVAPRRVYVRDCYRVWRRIYVPGEGYVRSRVRVCD